MTKKAKKLKFELECRMSKVKYPNKPDSIVIIKIPVYLRKRKIKFNYNWIILGELLKELGYKDTTNPYLTVNFTIGTKSYKLGEISERISRPNYCIINLDRKIYFFEMYFKDFYDFRNVMKFTTNPCPL